MSYKIVGIRKRPPISISSVAVLLKPCLRTVWWGEHQKRLAFPYMLFFVDFRCVSNRIVNTYKYIQLRKTFVLNDIKSEAGFKLNHLYCTSMPNIYGLKVCMEIDNPNYTTIDSMINSVLNCYWNTEFADPSHNVDLRKMIHPDITSGELWQRRSKIDPNFVMRLNWIKVRRNAVELLDHPEIVR